MVRIAFLAISVLAFLVTEAGRFVWRPYARANAIQDFGIADSIGNLGGIVVQIFFALAIMNPTKAQSYRLAVFFSIGYILYEIVQPYLPRGVFDWKDIYGTLIGLVVSVVVLFLLWRLFPEVTYDVEQS